MSVRSTWNRFDHYAYGAIAVAGTAGAIVVLAWAMTLPAWTGLVPAMQQIASPFLNILGVLFGLTLAFLANDTWSAHTQARNAVLREADAIRGLEILLRKAGESGRGLRAAVHLYAAAAAGEWRALARCETSGEAANAADLMLDRSADPDLADTAGPVVHKAILDLIGEIRSNRWLRVGLSRAHINPLKWLSMAFLGFLTLLSIAVIHAGAPMAALIGMGLFGLAAAPTAAIVLVHGNPFQPPYAVSPAELRDALTGIASAPADRPDQPT
ncbi:hypothetical protein RXV95_04085 [Novosphingobium sp. ZN18A2]|uniref:bestrophin-like domain n=1 Tax=Novosphingobium sp. ZN18A2 TaxID=3079861 RepID=UPI0030D39750